MEKDAGEKVEKDAGEKVEKDAGEKVEEDAGVKVEEDEKEKEKEGRDDVERGHYNWLETTNLVSWYQVGLLLFRNFFVDMSGPILPDNPQLLTK